MSSLEVCLDGCQGELTPVPPLGDGLEASGALQEGAVCGILLLQVTTIILFVSHIVIL